MAPRKRLPEHHSDCPDVGGLARLLSREAFRGDIRERSGYVALGGQRLRLGHPCEAEVEQPHRDAVAVGEQHVRRLHVAVEDPGGMSVRQAVADLAARLERRRVVQLAGAECLPKRAPRHELVGDVDMPGVAPERIGTQATPVPELRGGRRLALCTCSCLSLAGDDLERDVEPCVLVSRQPDRPRAAAPQRTQRAVPVEDEPGAFEGKSSIGHGSNSLAVRGSFPLSPPSQGDPRSTVWPDDLTA